MQPIVVQQNVTWAHDLLKKRKMNSIIRTLFITHYKHRACHMRVISLSIKETKDTRQAQGNV